MSQLDLFAEKKPAAVLYAFPMRRQIGLARTVARRIFDGNHAKAQASFNREVRIISHGLRDMGFDDEQVKTELRAFTDLVNSEIASLFDNAQRGTR